MILYQVLYRNRLLFDAIIVIVIIQFLNFFSLSSIDESSFRLTILRGTGFLLMVVSFMGLLFQKGIKKHPLDALVLMYTFSIIISTFMANLYWEQSFYDSVKEYRFFYIFFIYFILIFFNVSPDRIERIIILFFFISLAIFLIDFITFPDPIFSWRNEERRNGITIFFFGQGFTFLGGFYFLNRFFCKKNLFHLMFFLLSFVCLFMLTQSRMNLLALVLGFFFTFLNSDFKKKYIITVILGIAGIIFYASSDMFKGIKEDSEEQAKFYKEDVRLSAHKYFLTELQGGVPTMLLGNGLPSSGSNLSIASVKGHTMGYWEADVGLTAIFSYFGLLGVIIWVLFFYNVFKMPNTHNSIYLKSYFITLLTTAFVALSIFDPGYMPATILVLYLCRCETSKDQILEV